MNIKENLINALTGKDVEMTPVTAFPTIVTEQLLFKANTSFSEANNDPEIMAKVAASIYEYTGIEGITIPLDLWFEVESVGYIIERKENSFIPKIKDAPFEEPEDIEIPDDFTSQGRFPVIEKAIKIIHEKYDDKNIPLIGEVTGPFTLLTDLVNMEKIIKMINSDYIEIDYALEYINESLIDEIKFYQDLNVDCIVVNDPSATANIIKPDLFIDLIQPYLINLSNTLNVPGVLHICGDTNPNLEGMLSCGYEGLSISQEVDIKHAKQIQEKIGSKTNICGNLSISDTLLMRSKEEVEEQSKICLDNNVDVLGPSCNIAPETPLSNMKAMVEARNKFFE